MTKIPSVEERATMFKEFYCECNGSMTSDAIYATTHRIITEDRLALLTELRKTIQTIDFYGWNEQTQSKIKEKVQAHLDELINSSRLELNNP